MANLCTERLGTIERFEVRQDSDCWKSKLIHSVGLDIILDLLLGTQVLEELGLLNDCKPASVSNWSYDEKCLFCCLRREKVKEHITALNKQIVDSGGKPLLGKDPSNINRLELKSEEFLNAVLHKNEYTPRIPDPHIPVVACGVMRQMLGELTTYYTSRNGSQESLQNNGKKDQSLCVASSATAGVITTTQNKFIMGDQDAPLDLSVKKIKEENVEQDGVLDLSTKKSLKKNSHVHVSPPAHVVERDSVDLSLARVGDLQSASTLEQFMSKLCSHHQRQIVDALGFLQSEVKTTNHHFQAPTSALSEKQATTGCCNVSESPRADRGCAAVSITRSQKTTGEVLNADDGSIAKTVDLCKKEVLSSASSVVEHSPTNLLTTDHQEAEQLVGSSEPEKKCLCGAERCLPTCSTASDQGDLSSKHTVDQREDAVVNPSTVQKPSSVVSPISSRTARKSRKGSCLRPRNGSLSCIISDPDSHCDLVYIKKSIIECQPQSRARLHPRNNARKSTRGHKYVEEYLELQTIRTLARKSIHSSVGNCPTRWADVQASVTPMQSLSSSGSVPLVNAPFTGDCMKNIIQKLSTEQIGAEEMPGDVVKVTGISLMVESSQTDKTETNSQISHEPSCKESELSTQPDVATSCTPNEVEQDGQVVEVTETESRDPPTVAVVDEESKAESEDKSLEPSLATESSTNGVDEQSGAENPTEVESPADVQEASEVNANAEEEQVLHDPGSNLQTGNSSKLPDSGGSGLEEVSVQPLSKSNTPKPTVASDRCLRSRVSKGRVDVLKDSLKHGGSELVDQASESPSVCTGDSKPLEIHAPKPDNVVVDHAVKTTPKPQGAAAVERGEEQSPNVEMNDLPIVSSPEVLPETVSTASTSKLNTSSPVELPVSGDCSPTKKSPPSSENMLLRRRGNSEQLGSSKSSSLSEGQAIDQGSNGDLSSERVSCMPLRSRTISTNKQTVTRDGQPDSPPSKNICKRTEANGHMPLRSSGSGTAEQPSDNKSAALESPGRMSLRRGNVSNTEKTCVSTTPPTKNKPPLRIQKVPSSGEAEENPTSSKLDVQNKAQIRGPLSLADQALHGAPPRTEPVVCSPPKFLEALRGEEHQQLISNLNAKFDKMHKGWVQMDKEGQPAPKPKNKADRLKEIWKSKRRVRKSRPLEQQKFSPVQMLFMKPFDLSSICRWFLESTETKSLVIVKKVNTRLPSETELCFHSSAAGAGSAHGIFPSIQAERLKKHLKKFAIASPVKNTPKNQRLLSKALGQGVPVMRSKEKHKLTTATRICTKAQSLAGVTPTQAPESLGAPAGGAKNPASARILRKYSNLREKLQVQQNKKCKEKAMIPKKEKLQTRKDPKSIVVQRISSLSKVAKANSALKERVLKRKDGGKRLQGIKRMTKAIGAHSSASSLSKKLIRTDKAQQTKASGSKVDAKKGLEPQSSDAESKTLEDQVLTRSQRKMEGASSQTGSPKAATKRGLEPLVTPTKRSRTSKS